MGKYFSKYLHSITLKYTDFLTGITLFEKFLRNLTNNDDTLIHITKYEKYLGGINFV